MELRKNILSAAIALAMAFTVGCGGTLDDIQYGSGNSADQSDELSTTGWQYFVGAWKGEGYVYDIVFTTTEEETGHHFFAKVDSGIRCIRGEDCPSIIRAEGWYKISGRRITLSASDGIGFPGRLFGTYRFTNSAGQLRMTKEGETIEFHKIDSFCETDVDCNDQGLAAPTASPMWICTTGNICEHKTPEMTAEAFEALPTSVKLGTDAEPVGVFLRDHYQILWGEKALDVDVNLKTLVDAQPELVISELYLFSKDSNGTVKQVQLFRDVNASLGPALGGHGFYATLFLAAELEAEGFEYSVAVIGTVNGESFAVRAKDFQSVDVVND